MEILAENRFTLTKGLFYEGMARTNRESYGKFAKKALLFLCAAWLLMLGVTLWMKANVISALIELVVLAAVAAWIYIFLPRSKARQAFKALQSKYGGDMERTTRFLGDRLELEAGGTQTVVAYSAIKQVLTSKRLLVLVDADKKGVPLLRDGFVRGDERTVRDLIEAVWANEGA